MIWEIQKTKNDRRFLNIISSSVFSVLSVVNFFESLIRETAAGNLSPGQNGHEGYPVFIADQAVKMARFLVDEDNDILFRKRWG